jgi:hypothetical protein
MQYSLVSSWPKLGSNNERIPASCPDSPEEEEKKT